jgi:glycosyltransferase involved in cell wall biosynthesis
MITVVHILGSSQREARGIVQIVEGLRRGLKTEEFEICAVFLRGDGPEVEKLTRLGVATGTVEWAHPLRVLGAWQLWRLLRKLQPDIIHQHYGGRTVRRLLRASTIAKIVVHMHGSGRESEDHQYRTIPLPFADAVIANSEFTASLAQRCRPIVIYGGIEVSPPQSRIKHAKVVLGTAGRLVHIKGLHDLIDAVAGLAPDYPELHLKIAGDGPDRASLELRCAQLGLSGRVTLVGWQEDISSFLAECDIFVQPSHQEGFGMSVLEAMAAGLPVVAANVGGLRELVEDGVTGCLTPAKDSTALAQAIQALLNDEPRRNRMGNAGRERAASCFSRHKMAEETRELYLSLAQKD